LPAVSKDAAGAAQRALGVDVDCERLCLPLLASPAGDEEVIAIQTAVSKRVRPARDADPGYRSPNAVSSALRLSGRCSTFPASLRFLTSARNASSCSFSLRPLRLVAGRF
jgi:hypothetical protein